MSNNPCLLTPYTPDRSLLLFLSPPRLIVVDPESLVLGQRLLRRRPKLVSFECWKRPAAWGKRVKHPLSFETSTATTSSGRRLATSLATSLPSRGMKLPRPLADPVFDLGAASNKMILATHKTTTLLRPHLGDRCHLHFPLLCSYQRY